MSPTMLAVVVARYGGMLELMDRSVLRPGAGEVLVRVRVSGLCSTDLHLLSGRMLLGDLPRILGHESAGEIVEVGERVRAGMPETASPSPWMWYAVHAGTASPGKPNAARRCSGQVLSVTAGMPSTLRCPRRM